MKTHRVNVHVPVFQANEALRLDRLMPYIGVRQVFNSDSSELPFVSSFERLHVDKIYHEAKFEFNKRGTGDEADNGERGPNGPKQSKPTGKLTEVLINRPFMYVVVEKNTRSIIYIGRLATL